MKITKEQIKEFSRSQQQKNKLRLLDAQRKSKLSRMYSKDQPILMILAFLVSFPIFLLVTIYSCFQSLKDEKEIDVEFSIKEKEISQKYNSRELK